MAKKKSGRKRSAGEGSLYHRADGKWECKIPVVKDGKSTRKSFYGATEKEAKDKRDQFLTEIRTGTYIEKTKNTFGDWVNNYLELFVKPTVKMSTYSKYQINFKTHIKIGLGDIELQKVTTEDIQRFYNEKAEKLSTSVIAILHQIINGSLKQAVRQKKILNNPAEFTVRAKVQYKDIAPLDRNEAKAYLEAAKGNPLYPAFLLDLYTGLRKGELLALRWSDISLKTKKGILVTMKGKLDWKKIDINSGVITVKQSLSRVEDYDGNTHLLFSEPKTASAKRDIPLHPSVIPALKAHRAKQDKERMKMGKDYQDKYLVFCTSIGTPIEPRKILRVHKEILEKAKLRPELTVHSLRHSFGTLLAQDGENPKNLQTLLGHADARTTIQTYIHSSIEDKKRTIDRLGSIIKA